MGLIKLLFLFICFGVISGELRNGNDGEALALLILGALLWHWRAVMEWIQDRRWRRDWRTW
jgi:hypothetical protein